MPAPSASAGIASVRSAQVRFSIKIPALKSVSAKRSRHYVSPLTYTLNIFQNGTLLASVPLGQPATCPANSDGSLTCQVDFAATPGSNQVFEVQAQGVSAFGPGAILSAQSVVASIVTGQQNLLSFVLGGVPAKIAIAITQPLTTGIAGSTNVYVNAFDDSGQTILGPAPFSDANGNPVAITLQNADTSGHTKLSSTSITQPGQTVLLTYDGGPVTSQTITGTASGIATQSVADFSCPAAGTANEFLASSYNSATTAYQINRYPLAGNGTVMTAQAPLLGVGPQFITDAAGNIFALSNSAEYEIDEYCAGASGNAAPIAQFEFPTNVNGAAFYRSFTIDPAGNHIVVYLQVNNGFVKGYPIIVQGYGSQNQTLFGPLVITADFDLYPEFESVAAGLHNVYVAASLKVASIATTGSNATNVYAAGSGFIDPVSVAVDGSGNVYVLYSALGSYYGAENSDLSGSPEIAEYAPDGTVLRTISGAATSIFPNSLAVDKGGNIFVTSGTFDCRGCGTANAISVFGPSQSGNVAPMRTFLSSEPPGQIAGVDRSGNVYVYDTLSISVYSANGTLARQIALPSSTTAVAVAPSGRIAYISNGQIYTLPAAATSASQSTESLVVDSPMMGGKIALDPTTNELFVTNGDTVIVANASGSVIERSFSYSTPIASPAFAIGPNGNFVTIDGNDVLNYPSTASGSNASPSGGYSNYSVSSEDASVGVDRTTGDVLVASCMPGSVGVFAPGFTGTPLRAIAGYKTTLGLSSNLQCPGPPTMDINGAIYVPLGGQILEFAAGANGNVAPIATLPGVLQGAVGLAASDKRRGNLASALTGAATCAAGPSGGVARCAARNRTLRAMLTSNRVR